MGIDISLEVKVDVGGTELYEVELYTDGHTHNCTPMWKMAGIYETLYESQGRPAIELVYHLQKGYDHMVKNKDQYIKLNPINGWGSYDTAIVFVRNLLKACKEYPKSTINVSR